jgi:hypothetical protein
MAVLYPRDDFARVYKVLEDLAGDPRQIATTTDGPGLGLVISDDLYLRFLEAEGISTDEDEETETPTKKRPGRPRKNQES